jgi:hypothetical protein
MVTYPIRGIRRKRRERLIFDNNLANFMADATFMYAVTAGIFVFLVAILFGSRATRKRHATGKESTESESESSGNSNEGRRIKRFRSDGTPVYD